MRQISRMIAEAVIDPTDDGGTGNGAEETPVKAQGKELCATFPIYPGL